MLEDAACVHITHCRNTQIEMRREENMSFFSSKETKDWYHVTNGVPFLLASQHVKTQKAILMINLDGGRKRRYYLIVYLIHVDI